MKNQFHITQKLFCLLVLSSNLFANAPVTLAEGLNLKPVAAEHNLASVLNVFRVFTGSDAGREELQKLRSEGYACQGALANLARCTKILSEPVHSNALVSARVAQSAMKVPSVVTGALRESPALEHESEAYLEWRVEQDITVSGVRFNHYRVRYLVGASLYKVVVGQDLSQVEFLLEGQNLSRWVDTSISHDNGFTRYGSIVPYR